MKKILAALLLLTVAGTGFALVPGGSMEFLEQRLAEVDASLLKIRVDLIEGRVAEAQKADMAALQRNLETEKALLLERKELLKRLDIQSPAAAASPPAPAAPATTPAVPASPAAPSASASLTPISAPKPRIPDPACQQRLAGWVGLEFAVLPEGKVADVKVTGSEPKGAFDSAAVEAVSGRTYAARPLPVKVREKVFLSFADCRSEQLRASATEATGAATLAAGECANIAASARAVGAPFAAAESARGVLAGGAQAYSAPSLHCPVAGKRLKAGMRLVARIEYQDFSLVSTEKGTDEVWVRSNQLKDTTP